MTLLVQGVRLSVYKERGVTDRLEGQLPRDTSHVSVMEKIYTVTHCGTQEWSEEDSIPEVTGGWSGLERQSTDW